MVMCRQCDFFSFILVGFIIGSIVLVAGYADDIVDYHFS
jgi:hypothetical protein